MFLDFLFPKTCVYCKRLGQYICNDCFEKVVFLEKQFCPVCFKDAINGVTHPICKKTFGLDGLISIVYFDSPVKELVYNLKYKLVTDLVKEVVTKFEFGQVPKQIKFITPVPLFKRKENFRGFNQAELLAKSYAEKLELEVQGVLERIKPTLQQAKLDKISRKKNLEGAFQVKRNLKIQDQDYFLFDDVWTTGFTLSSAAKELKKAGANKVFALTLARSR